MDIDGIKQVFENWKKVLNHPRAVLDKKRVKVINERLRDGYTVEELNLVPHGVKLSPWNMGQNPNGTVYDSIGLIYRDADHIEKFIALANSKKSAPTSSTCRFCQWYSEDPTLQPCPNHNKAAYDLYMRNKQYAGN